MNNEQNINDILKLLKSSYDDKTEMAALSPISQRVRR